MPDPLSPIINENLAVALAFYAGRLDDAMPVVNKLIQTEPGLAGPYAIRSNCHALRGLRKEALADVEMFYKLTKNECHYKVLRAETEALLGNREDALSLIEEAIPLIETSPNPLSPMWVYAIIGDKDRFFKWADWTIERRERTGLEIAMDLRYSPGIEEVREDPRCTELFNKLNLLW